MVPAGFRETVIRVLVVGGGGSGCMGYAHSVSVCCLDVYVSFSLFVCLVSLIVVVAYAYSGGGGGCVKAVKMKVSEGPPLQVTVGKGLCVVFLCLFFVAHFVCLFV